MTCKKSDGDYRVGRLFTGLTLATLLATSAAWAENVKVAYIDPLSGSFANAGQNALRQLQEMARLANQSKWSGEHTLEVIGFDNKGSPQESLVQLKTAIDQGYRYVTQGAGSGVALALIDAINKHNQRNPGQEVLLLNYAAQDPDLTNGKCSFWHFRFEANSDMRVEALTSYMAKNKNIKSVYLIDQNYTYGQQVQRAARQYLRRKRPDIRIVGEDLHPLGQVKDFSPYVAKIKASGADTIFTGNWGADLSLLVKAIKEASLNVDLYSSYAVVTGVATAIGDSGADRVKTVATWHINNPGFHGSEMAQSYKKKYGNEFIAPSTYSVMATLGKAIRQAKSTDPVRVAFAMEGMKVAGLNGENVMRKSDHQLQQPLYVMTWTKVNGKDVKFDQENTGHGWKTSQKIDSFVATQPTSCDMKRPADVPRAER